MTELFDTLRSYESNDSQMRDLKRRFHLDTLEAARASYAAALSMVQAAFSQCSSSATLVEELSVPGRAFKWADRNDPTRLFSHPEDLVGERIVGIIFADNLSAVETHVAKESGISAEAATDIVRTVAVVALACSIGLPEEEIDLAARISSDIDVQILPVAAPQATNTQTSPKGASRQAEPVGTGRGYKADSPAIIPTEKESATQQKLIAIAAAAAVVVVGVILVVTSGSDDGPAETLAYTSTPTSEPVADVVPDETQEEDEIAVDEANQGGTEDESETDDQDAAGDTEGLNRIVTYNVPMIDIASPDRDADGILGFDFDTETGEVCYRVSSTNVNGPFRTHIHVGGSEEKGGIVVDMGPQESGATGCLDNPPADIANILNNLDTHYAELHDVSEEWTIRGQLSDALEGATAVEPGLAFDPGSTGAYLAIGAGTATLKGEVPDLATATSLINLFTAGGSGVVVNNELSVNTEAPRPSGRIILSNHEFAIDSSDTGSIDPATEATLLAILKSQPGWKLTAIGRTDSAGSDLNNLELSLRRAKAIRAYLEDIEATAEPVLVRGAGDIEVQGRTLELEFVPQT